MALNPSDKFSTFDMSEGSTLRSGLENRHAPVVGPNMRKAGQLVAKQFVAEAKFMQRKRK